MPFSTAELWRIKSELGYNLLNVGADPFVGISQLLEQVVNQHIDAEVTTTCSTAVTAATSPTPVTLTLASATGFAANNRVFIDVDDRQENVTIQSLSGADITVQLSKAHSSTYPVALEGPIPLAREALNRILKAKKELADIFGEGALKRVDEIEFYDSGRSLFGSTGEAVKYWRGELSSRLGVPDMWRSRQHEGSAIALY